MGQFFLITNRLCQDAHENLFSIFRQKCGYNKNPTCRTFRCGFSSICSFSLLNCTSEKSNCEEDNDTFLTPNILSNTPSKWDTVDENESIEVDLAKEIEEIYDLDLEYEHNNEGGSLEECAIIYYAGYLAV
ncbi:Transposable element P transposase, partial [Aphis craccivora]